MHSHKSIWDKRTTGRLEKLVIKGKSGSRIAETLGTSKDAVISKCRRLGLVLSGSPFIYHPKKSKVKTSKRTVLPAKMSNLAA